MIRVLSIGNSFSQDAQRYLHKLALNEGEDIKCVNLMVGGCSLRMHHLNILGNKRAYGFEFNGEKTGISVSISEVLASDEWDFVTIQQVSNRAPFYDTYFPYINYIVDHVRLYAPQAKLLFHQTWAYDKACARITDELHLENAETMINAIIDTSERIKKEINFYGIIPSGEAVWKLSQKGVKQLHRDGCHIDLGIGRYLLALVWYKVLTGKYAKNDFDEFDVCVDKKETELAKAAVKEIV